MNKTSKGKDGRKKLNSVRKIREFASLLKEELESNTDIVTGVVDSKQFAIRVITLLDKFDL